MTRYRIIQRSSYVNPARIIYEVERRVLWWWENAGTGFLNLEAAKWRIYELRQAEANPIRQKVVYQDP